MPAAGEPGCRLMIRVGRMDTWTWYQSEVMKKSVCLLGRKSLVIAIQAKSSSFAQRLVGNHHRTHKAYHIILYRTKKVCCGKRIFNAWPRQVFPNLRGAGEAVAR